jgi:NADH:ubiquinone oxidoreductase subunit 6 (subunit J)
MANNNALKGKEMFLNILFILSALSVIGCGLGVVFAKKITHACIFLLGVLIGVAGLYITLGADLIGATQIMVYVGGVVILMLFAMMLTGGTEFVSKNVNLVDSMGNGLTYAYGITTASVLLLSCYKLVFLYKNVDLSKVTMKFESTVHAIGEQLITTHVLAFEASSVLLLGALIGAAIIARPKRDN